MRFPTPDDLPSSPPDAHCSARNGLLSPTRTTRPKEKRNPSVTPRRFGRFFTPRSSRPMTGRRILGNLGASDVNRQYHSPQSLTEDALSSDPIICSSPTDRCVGTGEHQIRKKRKRQAPDDIHDTANGRVEPVIRRRGVVSRDAPLPQLDLPRPPPLESSESFVDSTRDAHIDEQSDAGVRLFGSKRRATLNNFFKTSRGRDSPTLEVSLKKAQLVALGDKSSSEITDYKPTPIRRFRNRGTAAQLLDREHGFSTHAGHQHLAYPAWDYRAETASFYSGALDRHTCHNFEGTNNTIPFSLASSHLSSITAIGDEQGYVRFFNTTCFDDPEKPKVADHVQVQDNAITDVAFSQDDLRLGTACGNRTGRILDVTTKTVAVKLDAGHADGLNQLSFQPGQSGGSIVATSDKCGTIQIWDLRCCTAPVAAISGMDRPGRFPRRAEAAPYLANTVNTLDGAHERTLHGITSAASVTSIQWLHPGREHLLLSSSGADASIKLWDTRCIKRRRDIKDTPLAMTAQPSNHVWRSWGITSLALSSDSARFFAVCKDSIVYAYSTEHLILGTSDELHPGSTKRRPNAAKGLGPLYGLKHPSLNVGSFFVKAAIRRAQPHCSELLAIGSSSPDHSPVVFPTDERYFRSIDDRHAHLLPAAPKSAPARTFSPLPTETPSSAPIPIYNTGTALVRGHDREVTSLAWSYNGKLVTSSDDSVVRHWQQDANRARHLRQVGEFGGERHLAGWADVASDWDEDDD